MHARVAVNDDASARHAAADPFHARRVAANHQLVAGLAVDGEEVVDTLLPFAEINGKRADLLVRQAGDNIGRERFGFKRDGRRFPQRQGHHGRTA